MRGAEPIVLAHWPEFTLGKLTVRPPLRQLRHADGREEILEPRVMQVLVALAEAESGVVTRDVLIERCWDGRIVGEDAINRVMYRLRRLAEGIAAGSFRIDTVTKVGYRLLVEASANDAPPPPLPLSAPRRPDRRWLVAGCGAGLTAGVVALGLSRWRREPAAERDPLLYQANIAMMQGTAEGADQAIGLLNRAVETRPADADAWGMLAVSYAAAAEGRIARLEDDLSARARDAAAQAEKLAPGNPYAGVARALLIPQFGRWAEVERGLRSVQARAPDNQPLLLALSDLLGSVGRWREAAELMDKALLVHPPTPGLVQQHVVTLWSAGRLQEADQAMAKAFALYPTHFAVWFTRHRLLMHTGRADQALVQSQNREGRPGGVPEADFALDAQAAKALISGDPVELDRAVGAAVAAARQGAGYAENAIQFAAAAGCLDQAFAAAEAYYFDAGFTVSDQRFVSQQRSYTRRGDRRTRFLFYPSTTALRRDPRFAALTQRLTLDRYWAEAGVLPDYKRG